MDTVIETALIKVESRREKDSGKSDLKAEIQNEAIIETIPAKETVIIEQ